MKYLTKSVPEDHAYILPIGDIHFGDQSFKDEGMKKLKGYLDWVKARPNAFIFLMGDLFNVASRSSKTTPFETDTTEYIKAVDFFMPYADQIIGAIDGNHEYRMYDEFGISPLQLFCRELKIPYCKYSAVIRLKVGKRTEKGAGNRYHQNYFIYAHHCFDDQTELLTKSGWKKHGDLVLGEDVATLNIDNNIMEWNKINDIYRYDDFKTMVSFKTKSCDLVVSPDHTIINKSRDNGKYIKKFAKDFINKDLNVPSCATNNNKDYNIDDNLLKLLCWVLTEGTRFTSRLKHEVRITQSDKPKIDHYHILDIISKLSKKYKVVINTRLKYKKGNSGGINRNYDAYEIYINKCELSKKIRDLIPDKKIPDFFFKLSKRQFDLVLNEMSLGDGSFDKRYGTFNIQYSQKDKKEQDKLQALLSINGYRSVLSETIDKRNDLKMYRLSITNRETHRITKKASKEVKYGGIAWCVSVKNKTLIVRRNGKVSITGNTTGGGGSVGGKLNRVVKLESIVEGCDVYLGAHNHQLAIAPQDIFYVSMQGGVMKRRKWYVDCGSYLDWNDSYAEKGMLAPTKLGSPRIRLEGKKDKHDVHVSL